METVHPAMRRLTNHWPGRKGTQERETVSLNIGRGHPMEAWPNKLPGPQEPELQPRTRWLMES